VTKSLSDNVADRIDQLIFEGYMNTPTWLRWVELPRIPPEPEVESVREAAKRNLNSGLDDLIDQFVFEKLLPDLEPVMLQRIPTVSTLEVENAVKHGTLMRADSGGPGVPGFELYRWQGDYFYIVDPL
jgi:hypothetical protein